MPKHLEREIEGLKKSILYVGALAEESLNLAIQAMDERDSSMAEKVIETDGAIDQAEVDVEESCLKILALHQPVAIDLRFIVAVLKINNDLERIGDLASNIAERALQLMAWPGVRPPIDLRAMARRSSWMLKRSLDALVNLDVDAADEVCAADNEVDAMLREMFDGVKTGVRGNPEHADPLIQYLSVARYLERIADHATNVAEDVVYMIEGEIVRHRGEPPAAQTGE